MENNYVILIDSSEFQQKILDVVTSDILDKYINCTTFADNKDCRQAVIHGMCIATMLTSECNRYIIGSKDTTKSKKKRPCSECLHNEYRMPQCAECTSKNDFQYFCRKMIED